MKALKYFTIGIVLIMAFIPSVVISKDKTQSPYFLVDSGDSTKTSKMPLLHTGVQVSVEGVIAHVTVSQLYVNSGTTTIEAVYVFPGSTKAAVHGMNMRIGNREINAQIQEKQKARKQYEKAKKEGKTASLLEQIRPNVFKMQVGNIMPNDTIEVELVYTELLVPEKGIYEFVYPTVVGPRYTGGDKNAESALEINNIPYSGENVKPTYTFDVQITINAGIPIAKAQCSTHKMNKSSDGNTVRLLLENSEKHAANRDLMVQYSLRGNKIQTGILLHESEDENFFLMMVQPPENINEKQIVPREYVFILDVSGSMSGFPLDISKALFKKLVKELRPSDKFNLLAFAGGSEVLSERMLNATKENISMAVKKVGGFNGGGGTALLPALQKAYNMTEESNSSRIFVILTDGFVSVENETFKLIRNNLNKASVFTFGIGSSVNRHLLEGMAYAGKGEPIVVIEENKAKEAAQKFGEYIKSPLLRDIQVSFEGIEVYDIEPPQIPDMLAERPIVICGKYKGKAQGIATVKGITAGGKCIHSITMSDEKASNNASLSYLWARERLRLLADYDMVSITEKSKEGKKQEITQLGLTYNLLTPYTSFIAIDSEKRNFSGKSETVNQVIPLPEGVSEEYIPITRQIPIQPPPVLSKVQVVEDDFEFGDIEADEDMFIDFSMDEPQECEEKVYFIVEKMPSIKGVKGDFTTTLKNLLQLEVIYPPKAIESSIEGTVYISFAVDEKGKITDVKVVRGVSPELDAEAVRALKSWATKNKITPGNQRGKPVKVQFTMPVKFKLE